MWATLIPYMSDTAAKDCSVGALLESIVGCVQLGQGNICIECARVARQGLPGFNLLFTWEPRFSPCTQCPLRCSDAGEFDEKRSEKHLYRRTTGKSARGTSGAVYFATITGIRRPYGYNAGNSCEGNGE